MSNLTPTEQAVVYVSRAIQNIDDLDKGEYNEETIEQLRFWHQNPDEAEPVFERAIQEFSYRENESLARKNAREWLQEAQKARRDRDSFARICNLMREGLSPMEAVVYHAANDRYIPVWQLSKEGGRFSTGRQNSNLTKAKTNAEDKIDEAD